MKQKCGIILYGDYRPVKHETPKFKVDGKVRITKRKGIFEKGYTPRWTKEIFAVSEFVAPTH